VILIKISWLKLMQPISLKFGGNVQDYNFNRCCKILVAKAADQYVHETIRIMKCRF